ncbi:MAG: hypothetical protein SFY68_02785, partial [Candidatus Sumerlaeia bacterium]|nr:hypothetical protein [Candidatus Sumerlaeia bacterium]
GMTEAQAQTQAKTEVEQILQEVATKRAEEQEAFEKRQRLNPLRYIPFTPLLKLVQFALALVLMVLPLLGIKQIGAFVPSEYHAPFITLYQASSMNFAETTAAPTTLAEAATGTAVASPLAFAGGLVLFLLLFSRGAFFVFLSVIGGGAFLLSRTLIDAAEQQPYAMTLLLYSSLGMIAFSFLCRVLLRLTGGKY